MQIQIYISVTVLILIQKSASKTVSLPSPASVSIQCDSYGAEVRWEYPDLDQDVYFQVEVKDDFNERNSNITQNLHLNISSMLFKPAYNRYYVTVTAVRGGEKSEPPPPDSAIIQFSYNGRATSNIKCYLDFPEVELSPKDGKLHVQFINPLQLYRNSPALRDHTDNLQYCIETEEGMNEVCETCEIKQNTCETSIVFSEHRGEYCVNLTGSVGQRFFNLRSSCFTGDIRSCYLDFPEVELSPKDGKLHVQFINPLQLYRNSPALRELNDNLQYCIETEEGKNEVCETCEIKQNTCETSIVFSEHRGEYCVNLTGSVGQRFFNLRSGCFTGDIRSSFHCTRHELMDWSGVEYLWITLLFLSAVCVLILTALIHCRGSKGVMLHFSKSDGATNSSTTWMA